MPSQTNFNTIKTLIKILFSKRYRNILLSDYINELDYQEIKQFAAITFQLPDNSIYMYKVIHINIINKSKYKKHILIIIFHLNNWIFLN